MNHESKTQMILEDKEGKNINKAEPALHESCHDAQVYFWAHMLDDYFDK